MDWGLLGAVGQGLQAGMGAYRDTKQQAYENAVKNRQQQMQMTSQGLVDDGSGGVQLNPEKQQEQQLKISENQRSMDEIDPQKPASQRARDQGKSYFNGVKPGSGDFISDDYSAKDVENAIKNYKEFGNIESAKQKAIIAGQYGVEKAGVSNGRMQQSLDLRREQLGERQSQNAIQVGKEYEHDPIILNSKKNLNSLEKSSSILENPDKPVTAKDLNLAYQDYINSTAAGGAATEGKVNRELPETWAQQWNEVRGKAGDFKDLRKSETGAKLIDMLKSNIKTVKSDMNKQIASQAENIHQNYLSSPNKGVQSQNELKYKKYHGLVGEPQQQGLVSAPAQDVDAVQKFATDHGLTFEAANKLIEARKAQGAK